MSTLSGDTLRGHLETMVLAVLQRREAHGYEILRRLEEAGCGALRLKEGTLYPALYRLERDGLVEAAWERDVQRRGPRRRIYCLTPKGKRQLKGRRLAWKEFVSVIGRIVEAPA